MHLLLLSLLPALASAQQLYLPDTSIKVFAYGQQQNLAWCGGMNNAQFAMADLNHDGLQDLVVFQPWGSLLTFINKGVAGSPYYIYAPEYALNFPPVMDYLVMADYNCDGIPDLFHQGNYGFAVYKGYYNTENQLCFTFYKNLFYTDSLVPGGPVNAFVNPGDIPAIVDVDGDGDLDFLSYNVGGQLTLYKNMRVELGLPCDSIQIVEADRCWGRFYENYTHPVLQACGSTSPEQNSLCLFDYDMDGDYDLLLGRTEFNQVTLLNNGRIPFNPTGADSMVSYDTAWQSAGTEVNIYSYPAAFNIDVDQDGKKDLVLAPNSVSGSASAGSKSFYYFKNLSAAGAPNWVFQSDSFLVDKMIDLGSAAYPMLFDFNKDGLPDLFVGSDGYFVDSNQTLRSRLSYYLNTSTPGNPSFTLQTNDFLGLNALNYQGAAPAAGDLDNDGVADLVVGHTDGTLSFYRNMAATDAALPNWVLTEPVLKDVHGDTINVGNYAAPFLYDVDKDGKKDLLIGSIYGTVAFYQNVSTVPGVISLKLVNTDLGGVKADPRNTYWNLSVPFVGQCDSTHTDYLFLGSNSGNIYRFSGIAGGDTTATYSLLDSQFSYIDSTYNMYNHPALPGGMLYNQRSAITIGDISGNGSSYLLSGVDRGGVTLYGRNTRDVKTPVVSNHSNLLVYPNPAKDQLQLSWQPSGQKDVQISVMDMEGRQLYAATAPSAPGHYTIPVNMLASGVYVCVLKNGEERNYAKFTVVR